MGGKSLDTGFYTLKEYFEIDNASDIKYEYEEGKILAMSRGSVNHSRIGGNLFHHFRLKLGTQNSPCEPFNSDARVYIPKVDSSVHPDLLVVCDEIEFSDESEEAFVNPVLVVEVLSKSTKGYDRGEKFYKYRFLPSLEEYMLVDQYEQSIEIYRKTSDGNWLLLSFDSSHKVIQLESIGIALHFDEVYQNVS